MAHVKTLKNNELVGGQDDTPVYPVTSTQAIYSQDGEGNTRKKNNKPEKLEDRISALEAPITSGRLDPTFLNELTAIDDVPTENSDNPIKSGAMYTALGNKQNIIVDLNTIRSGASEGSISIQNIRNLMNACNEVFRIGFIGYHIEMSAEPDEEGNYDFNIVMNE